MKNLIENIKWSITCFVIDCQNDFNESKVGKLMPRRK